MTSYVISVEDLRDMQNRNHAIKTLKNKVQKNILPRLWNSKILNQFKHSSKNLKILNGLLVKGGEMNSPVVASFPFLVEIVRKTHEKLNHLGRNKLVSAIQEHFWLFTIKGKGFL